MQKSIRTQGLFYSVIVAALMFPLSSSAQLTEYEIARDTITQWIYYNNVIKKKTYQQVKLPDGRVYSVWQQTIADSLQRWVQASYIPRASALDIRYNTYLDFENDKENIGPLHRYGLEYHMYPASYSKRKKKLDVGGEAPKVLSIYANGPIGKYVKTLSGKGRNWYIAMQPLNVKRNPTVSNDDGFLQELNTYPAIAPYLHFRKQYDIEHTIVLAQNNELPFIKVTVKEYLQAFEEFTKSRLTTTDQNYKLPPEMVAEELKKIQLIRERLEDMLSEPVKFCTEDGYYDPSEICTGKNCKENTFEMYQLSAETIALMKKDKPLWINITLRWSPDILCNYQLYQSVCTNFNFEYLYNYFFEPEKVKNIVYTPLYAPIKKLPPKSYTSQRSAQSKKSKENTDILFFEDFSGNIIGAEPVGWFSKLNNGSLSSNFSSIHQPENEKGLWLSLYPRHVAISNELNTPLPQNFTISFEISCTDNYTWGSSALSFYLSDIRDNDELLNSNFGLENLGRNSNSTMLLKIRPAVNNSEGVEFSFSSPKVGSKYSEIRKYDRKISSFTGNRGSTKAKVVIQVKGTAINISINNELVLDEKNIIPAGVIFSTMSWAALGSVMEGRDIMYLSNIKITKD